MKAFSYNQYLKESSGNSCFYTFSGKRPFWKFIWHYHPEEFEIIMPHSSISIECIVGDYSSSVENDSIFLIPPNLSHSFHTKSTENNKGNCVIAYGLRFRSNFFSQQSIIAPETKKISRFFDSSSRGIMFYDKSARKLGKLLKNLAKQENNGSTDSFCMFIKFAETMATENQYKKLATDLYIPPKKHLNINRINKILGYIHKNYTQQISIEDISNTLNMSISTLYLLFKKTTGKTIISYINELRIAHASDMLLETDYNILEICYMCGFQNVSYFNRKFKAIKGITPTQYRNKQTYTSKPSPERIKELSS